MPLFKKCIGINRVFLRKGKKAPKLRFTKKKFLNKSFKKKNPLKRKKFRYGKKKGKK